MPISRQLAAVLDSNPAYAAFRKIYYGRWAPLVARADVCNFVFGNPGEMPPPALVDALARATLPRTPDWYAYAINTAPSRRHVAGVLRERTGVAYDPDDIYVTNGGFGALSTLWKAILDPGDEVVFVTPSFFFYEQLLAAAGAVPVRVPARRPSFDLDLEAIAAAIGPRTRALLLNSPHNPSGRIYDAATLEALAGILAARDVILVSDEAFARVILDEGRAFVPPTRFYARSFLVYTYSKILMAPGERIGYIAVHPDMPGREALRTAMPVAQIVTGFAFPNATLVHALPDIENVSFDIPAMRRRRDRLVAGLRALGYEPLPPEACFHMLVRSPIDDDLAFAERLTAHGVLVLPASVMNFPGYFRVALTVSDDTIERSLVGFERAIAELKAR